jgi:4-hydroxy-tetrahydrodipicolinate synthase
LFPGVYAAAATPFRADGEIDLDAFSAHCRWMVDAGVAGVVPNGSLGEYETMTSTERAAVVKAAIDGVGADRVIPGVSGKSGREARQWAEQAAESGVSAVMCLPPTSHAPTDDEVIAHFAEVGKVDLPIIAYNNPYSTRADLTPELLRKIADATPKVVAVKEFSQDVRRVAQINESAPQLEIICGCDDVFVESMLMGATGWIAGFVNAFPAESVRLYDLCTDQKWSDAVELYRRMLPLLRFDARPNFVQAVKIAQDEVGRYGGPVRLPRLPLPAADADAVRRAARLVTP